MIAALSAGTASAQWPATALGPRSRNLDARGVDLSSGKFYLNWGSVSIGQPGAGGLDYVHGAWWGGASAPFGTLNKEVVNSETTVTVTLGGVSEAFTLDGGNYSSNQGSGSTLTYVGGGTNSYYYTLADGTSAIFEQSKVTETPWVANEGLLVQIIRPDGESIEYVYKSYTGSTGLKVNRPVSIGNNLGYQINFEYENQGTGPESLRLSKVTAFNRAVEYCAPAAQSCTFTHTWPTLVVSNGGQTVIDSVGRISQFATTGYTGYLSRSGMADVVYTVDAVGTVSTVNDGAGTWYYNWSNPDADTLQVVVTDPLSKQRTIKTDIAAVGLKYNSATRWSLSHDGYGRAEYGHLPSGQGAEFLYDSRGNAVRTMRISNDPLHWGDIAIYDPRPSGCANQKTCNRPYQHIDGRGGVTDYVYNPYNGAIETVLQPTAPNGARPRWDYTYDPFYAKVRNASGVLINAATPVWRQGYSIHCKANTGSCAGTANQLKVMNAYTVTQNLARTEQLEAAGDNSVQRATTWTYNNTGDVATATVGSGVTTYSYDALRRVTLTKGTAYATDPAVSSAPVRNATRLSYHSNGQVSLTEIGYVNSADIFVPLQQEARTYTNQGRLERETFLSGVTVYRITQYRYNARGELICKAQRRNLALPSQPADACDAAAAGSSGPDQITTYTYDDDGRPLTVNNGGQPGGADDTTTVYQSDGLVQDVKDAENNTYRYLWDGHNRHRQLQYPDPTTGAPSPSITEAYIYDDADNQTHFTNREGNTVVSVYDALNRLSSTNTPAESYTYDDSGRAIAISSPDASLSFAYNALGWQMAAGGAYGATYQYDAVGRRERMTWPDGFYVTYVYDNANHLKEIRENGGSTVLVSFTYDELGRRRKKTFWNGLSTVSTYDAASRLDQLSFPAWSRSMSYTYDDASRIRTKSASHADLLWRGHAAVDRSYDVDALNRLTASGPTGGGTTNTYGYDQRGDLQTDGVGPTAYFDIRNRWTFDNAGVSMQYDALSRLHRVHSSVAGAGQDFGYDGDDLISEYAAGSTTLLNRYVHGPGTDEPLVAYSGSGVGDKRSLTADERGSIIDVSNASGTSLLTQTYDDYGVTAVSSPLGYGQGRFGYTGQMWIPQIGQYHYKARVYSQTLGRFLQTDPIRLGAGMNMYAYVGGDPINYTDPTGMWGCDNDDGTTNWDLCRGGGLGGFLAHLVSGIGNAAIDAFGAAGSFIGAFAPSPGYVGTGATGGAGAAAGGSTLVEEVVVTAAPRLAATPLAAVGGGLALAFTPSQTASDDESMRIGYHYTSPEAAASIAASGTIAANKGKVYFTDTPLAASEVNNALFMGVKPNNGAYVVQFQYPVSMPRVPDGGTGGFAGAAIQNWIHYGSIRDSGPVKFLYVGPNPR